MAYRHTQEEIDDAAVIGGLFFLLILILIMAYVFVWYVPEKGIEKKIKTHSYEFCLRNNGLPYSFHNKEISFGYKRNFLESDDINTIYLDVDCISEDHIIMSIDSLDKYQKLTRILYGHKKFYNNNHQKYLNYFGAIDKKVWAVIYVNDKKELEKYNQINTFDLIYKKTFVHVNELKQ